MANDQNLRKLTARQAREIGKLADAVSLAEKEAN